MQALHPLTEDRVRFKQVDEDHRVPIDPIHPFGSEFCCSRFSASYRSHTSGPHSRSRRKNSSPPPSALKVSAQSPKSAFNPLPSGPVLDGRPFWLDDSSTWYTNWTVVLGPPEGGPPIFSINWTPASCWNSLDDKVEKTEGVLLVQPSSFWTFPTLT